MTANEAPLKIKEIIVVEGRRDTEAVRRAVIADTLETGGSAIGEQVIRSIRLAQQKRGVILFTDPDGAGKRIRRIISEQVPGCKHAFLPRDQAKGTEGIGVEYATSEAIRHALENVYSEATESTEKISWDQYLDAGLVGGNRARLRRQALADELGIGYGNAQQFFNRLNIFSITLEELNQALAKIERDQAILSD